MKGRTTAMTAVAGFEYFRKNERLGDFGRSHGSLGFRFQHGAV